MARVTALHQTSDRSFPFPVHCDPYTMMLRLGSPPQTPAHSRISTTTSHQNRKNSFLIMFLAISLAQRLPKHVPDNPFSIPTYSYLNRTVTQAIAAMGSIIPTLAVDLRSIGESQVGQVLLTTPPISTGGF